jgi:hypothetical protein
LSPDLVLGTADSYSWEQLRPFVESLQATGYDGEVCLVGRLDAETRGTLAAAGIEVVRPTLARIRVRGTEWRPYNPRTTRIRWHVQPLYRPAVRLLASLARDRVAARRRLTALLSNIEIARFFWYRDLLAERAGRYRNVLLTDIRDVLFLRDPFDFEVGGTAIYSLEAGAIESQVNNRGWLIGAYGQAVYESLRDRPISCAGVTLGTESAVRAYLEAMVGELVELERQFNGMDQGVHNYLVHTGRVEGRLVTNAEGPVLTLAIMSDEAAVELVRRRAGDARMLHQYDRHPAVLDALAPVPAEE